MTLLCKLRSILFYICNSAWCVLDTLIVSDNFAEEVVIREDNNVCTHTIIQSTPFLCISVYMYAAMQPLCGSVIYTIYPVLVLNVHTISDQLVTMNIIIDNHIVLTTYSQAFLTVVWYCVRYSTALKHCD